MTSIIWGAFGLTLTLIVAVGAMIQYLKDREKYKKTKDDEWNKMVDMISVVPVEPTPNISEPVTSFIKCFKDNPKRFKVKVSGNGAGYQYLRDTVENVSYPFIVNTRYGSDGKALHSLNVTKKLQWLTDSEEDAIMSTMYPYFVTERRDRLHALQRQRLTRIYKEKPNV